MKTDADTEETQEPVIDAAFMETILETDIANIVKKAFNGTPLSKREREMVEYERTRLLLKSQPTFKLEGEGPVNRLEGLKQEELAHEWGYSVRSIKGWLADGRAKNDPCPLKHPGDMLAWFSRMHVGRDVPEKLRDAVMRLQDTQNTKAVALEIVVKAPPVERIEIPEEQKGLLAMLNRYRDAEPALHRKYMDAIESGDEQKAGFYMREWSAMGEKLRALEKIAPKALEELGIYVKKDEVTRELETLHRAIVKSIRQALRMSRPRLRAAETGEEWNRVTDGIVDELCQMLVESEFAEPLLLEVA